MKFGDIAAHKQVSDDEFDLELRDLRSGATVWTHYYTQDEPVSGKDVPSIVAALDRNVQAGAKEVLAGLEQYSVAHSVK